MKPMNIAIILVVFTIIGVIIWKMIQRGKGK